MSQRGSSSQREALLKSYTRRLKDDVKSILDNYTEVIKVTKVCLFFVLTECPGNQTKCLNFISII